MHLRKSRKHKETVPFTKWLIVHPCSKERFLFMSRESLPWFTILVLVPQVQAHL